LRAAAAWAGKSVLTRCKRLTFDLVLALLIPVDLLIGALDWGVNVLRRVLGRDQEQTGLMRRWQGVERSLARARLLLVGADGSDQSKK
jgi:hypothetical protein